MDEADWLDLDDNTGQGARHDHLVETEWNKLTTKYSDAGYREGITDGKLSTLQAGFDQGFEMTVPASRRLGILRGRVNALLSFLLASPSAASPSAASSATASQSTNAFTSSTFSTPFTAPSITPTTTPAHDLIPLVEPTRELIRDLARIRRVDILPPDLERQAHEAEDRLNRGEDEPGNEFELEGNETRDMEGLEMAVEGMGGSEAGGGIGGQSRQNGDLERSVGGKREDILLDWLEGRFKELVTKVLV